jgi:ribosomal protection tetracycline resistance protein
VQTLNLGILAHVDAGKTSLTERLLYAAGVIDQPGSVDKGDTQTDTLALERQRGITIKSAVASFSIGGISVNMIDTPGHPDFIAEIERALRVLDGAVLVVSAVEGVQSQTRVLMRALFRLRIPTLVFVNKIDRTGAREDPLLREISEQLQLAVVSMGSTSALGTQGADFEEWQVDDVEHRSGLAEVLADHNEELLAGYIEGGGDVPFDRLHVELRMQVARGLVHPVFFGSARTGAGVASLMSAIAELLPPATGAPDANVSGTVFKIERGERGERIAYVRLISGTIRLRDRLLYGDGHADKVTAIGGFTRSAQELTSLSAGEIGKLRGLRKIQIGDRIGQVGADQPDQQFAPPTMESVVDARDSADRTRLRVALRELAEQDPYVKVRQDDSLNEMSVSLYGEIQKEIIQSTLAHDFGVAVRFRETTTIYIERLAGEGEAVEHLTSDANPYMATIGLRLTPGPVASGVELRLAVNPRSVPLYIYRTEGRFVDHMTQYIRVALARGLFGWEVTDCIVTVNECAYFVSDGPGKPTVPMARTTSADFRKLAPRVLRRALERAGTRVCEPMLRLTIESPSDSVGRLLNSVARLAGFVEQTSVGGHLSTIDVRLPTDRSLELQRELPELTRGEGSVETTFAGFQPVRGTPPNPRRREARSHKQKS